MSATASQFEVTRLPDLPAEPGQPARWFQLLINVDGQWVVQCHYGVCPQGEPVVRANAERDARVLRREVAIRYRPSGE